MLVCNPETRIMAAHRSERKRLGEHVHIIYIDDSKQDVKGKGRFQVIAGVIVDDQFFKTIEGYLGYVLYEQVLPHVTAGFDELHASDLLAGNKPFEAVKREQAMAILADAVELVESLPLPVVYGAIDLEKLWSTNYATANEVDMAFRICVKLVEEWFQGREAEPAFQSDANLGLLISDDSQKAVKNSMQNAFRLLRKRVVSSPPERGILEHLHDDMYFGDSKYSKGIQLADICALLIGRHLAGYSDTEDLYQRLSKHIFKSAVEPE
jgi:hypothetical protein